MVKVSATASEFEVSTGSNVFAGGNTSRFDIPLNTFSNLVVISQSGDPDPKYFDIGETYTLSYTSPSGTQTSVTGTVLRSDPLGGNAGVVVFEATDPEEGYMHFLWAPNFNVDNWINQRIGQNPSFYTGDQVGNIEYNYVCFTAGTPISTPAGPRPVESLKPGEPVTTADHGTQTLIWTGQSSVAGIGPAAPIRFAPGVLGNSKPLLVSPQHRILLSGPTVELMFGVPEVLAPAKGLVDGRSVSAHPQREVTYVHLLFERHEIVFAAGAATESLYMGDVSTQTLEDGAMGEVGLLVPTPDDTLPDTVREMRSARMLLRMRETRALAHAMGGTLHAGPRMADRTENAARISA